jgi:S-formylglutathione hydrolase FrmB
LWLVLLPTIARADGRVECRQIASQVLKRPVRYCILLPPSYDAEKTRRYPILYYLHGLGDNEQSLLSLGGWNLVEDLQDRSRIGEFLIVTPNGGRSFYIDSLDGRERYEEFFIREFIPAIERRYRALGTRAGRGISGTSMGGYGALRFAFKYPRLFSSVSAHSAVLVEKMSDDFTPAFGRNFSAFGAPFDSKYWQQNTPFALAGQTSRLGGLKIYFDCGRQDDYGFDAGAQALHDLLKLRSIPHEFHLYPGGHNWEFVAEHFDESLEFHSRAFAVRK